MSFYAADRYAAHVTALTAAGVDPGDVIWHVVHREDIQRVAAALVPQRFAHWHWGEQYLRQRQHAGRLYEMVCWLDPPVAYVDATLAAAEVDLIVPHVLGHAAVMRYNRWLGSAYRLSADQWAAHAAWVDRDAAAWSDEVLHATPPHADTAWHDFVRAVQAPPRPKVVTTVTVPPEPALWVEDHPLDWLLALDAATLPPWERDPVPVTVPWQQRTPRAGVPEAPPRDLALAAVGRATWDQVDVYDLLAAHAPSPRTREAVAWYRAESDYTHCLRATKLVNEGYASYWHGLRAPTVASERAVWEQAALRGGVERPSAVNPYWLGGALFRAAAATGRDPHALMRTADDRTLIAQGVTAAVVEDLRLIPLTVTDGAEEPGWDVWHERTADPAAVVAWRLQQTWDALMRGGVGTPRWAWEGPDALRVTGQWGIPELAPASARPLVVHARWLVGLATLLGRPIQVTVPPGTRWGGTADLLGGG